MTAMLAAALAYAARGWPVFPCKPGQKTPATTHGVLDATTDPARIHTWWTAMPDANVGIATGIPGPDVIDFDTDGDWATPLATLTQAGLITGHEPFVRTRSGGYHIYFEGTTQRSTTLRAKTGPSFPIDFKAAGGYVIAPGCYVAADDKPGGRYETITNGSTILGPADWRMIRDILIPPPPFQPPAAEKAALADTRGLAGTSYAAATSWPEILTPHGWRQIRQAGNARYWCRPGKTGRFISASTRDDGGLWVFSTSTSFEPEQLYSKFGAYAVLHGFGGDYKAAAAQLRADGYGDPLPTPPAAAPGLQQPAGAETEDDWWTPIAERHQLIDWVQLWEDTPEEEEWIVEPIIAAGRSIALYSPPKTGKSLLVLEMGAAIATGSPVLGRPAAKPRRVLYVDLENSRRDLRDRLDALGYKPADLANLAYLSFPSLPALDSARGGLEILGLAIAHNVELVIIDTVSRVISGGENDADTFAALYRHALAPLKGRGIAVIRIDHSGKDAGKGQRGSSAKNADVDAVWILTAAGPVMTLRCEMSRTAIEAPSLSLRRETGPLRHVPTTAAAAVTDRVQAMMAKLDELKVPVERGAPFCQKALNGAGVPVDKNVLAEAVRVRKMTIRLPESESAPQAPPAAPPDLPEDHQAGLNETGETADQTYLEDHQAGAGRLFQGAPAKPACAGGHPYGGPGQAGAGAPAQTAICTCCGERGHPATRCPAPGQVQP